MERAAQLIKNDKYSKRIIEDDAIVQGIWPIAVGKAIARHTGSLKIVRECLVVEVEDAVWQKQLHSLRGQIVDRVQKLTGSPLIQRVEFRVGIPRRAPQRAEVPHPPALLQAGQPSCAWSTQESDYRDSAKPQRSALPGSYLEGIEQDEADRIQDPVLKKVYRLSRKRATA